MTLSQSYTLSPFSNQQSLVQYTLLGHTHIHVINNMCISVCHMQVYTVKLTKTVKQKFVHNKQNILTFLSVVKILYIMNSWFINVFFGRWVGDFLKFLQILMHKTCTCTVWRIPEPLPSPPCTCIWTV